MTPEIEKVLTRYVQIQEEARRLADEKATLQERLACHLADFAEPFWFPVVAGQPLKVRVHHATEFVYDEDLLRQRLRERYTQILKPDPVKVRRHLPDVERLLWPALDLVGAPHRDQVRIAVEKGAVPRDAFTGAFEKVTWTSIAVSHVRDEAEGAGRQS
jgi:hypothetical protein